MENIEAREPHSMAEAETYWKSLWGEDAQHNERAERIRREQKRKASYMGWMPIQITEITSYLQHGESLRTRLILHICLKLTIGNLLEVIKYKITGLKFSQLLTGILPKISMQ